MTTISAEKIREVRERTSVGFGKCKQALLDAHGDVEQAIAILQKMGLTVSAKSAARETKEGCIFFAEQEDAVALVELRAETDFVVKNTLFQEFGQDIVNEVLKTKPVDIEAFSLQHLPTGGIHTVDQARALVVQKLGENVLISRLHLFNKPPQATVGVYSHRGGNILAWVMISGGSTAQKTAREIATHVVAENPKYLSTADVPAEVKAEQGELFSRFCEEHCLLEQKWIKDPSLSIKDLLQREGIRLDTKIEILNYQRWQVGA